MNLSPECEDIIFRSGVIQISLPSCQAEMKRNPEHRHPKLDYYRQKKPFLARFYDVDVVILTIFLD